MLQQQDEIQTEQPTTLEATDSATQPEAAKPEQVTLENSVDNAIQERFGDFSEDEYKPEEPDAKPIEGKATEAKPEEKAQDTKPDDDLIPPDGMKEASKERWGKLTERVKSAETQYQEVTQRLTAVQELVGKSTLTADEFTNVLELGRLTKSSNPEDRKRAVAQLHELLTDVSGSIGMEVKGFDPIDNHPDLKEALENMEISKESALELAQLRAIKAQGQQAQQATQAQQQTYQAVNQASVQAETWLKSMAATPGHEAKAKFVAEKLQDPAFQQNLINNFKPSQWTFVVQNLYSAYTPPALAAPAALQPLRSGVGAASKSLAPPKTLEESTLRAIDAHFGYA